MIGGGAAWGVAQRIELPPPEKVQLSTRAESQLAIKENQAEMKARNLQKGKEKGSSYGSWKGASKGEGKPTARARARKETEKMAGKKTPRPGSEPPPSARGVQLLLRHLWEKNPPTGECLSSGGSKPIHPEDSSGDVEMRRKKKTEAGPSADAGDAVDGSACSSALFCGKPFSSMVPHLESLLIRCCEQLGFAVRSKAKPTGNVFPLPTSLDSLRGIVGDSLEDLGLLRVLCLALNSYAGESMEGPAVVGKLHRSLLEGLLKDVQVVTSWTEKFERVSWESFFRSRGVDYMGDEVATAKFTSWCNLRSAIPSQVGTVELSDLLEGGCLHYVTHFEEYLFDEASRVYTPPPRVMVHDAAWDDVCAGLLETGICRVISEEDLFKVSGKPLLNGLFGVEKGETDGLFQVHRLIMNLIPLNNLCRGIQGDVATLPSWASMGPLTLMPTEQLLISSEDVRCFFYIFKVPSAWHRFLGFNKEISSKFTGGKPGKHYLCATVLPMGFKNSVSLAQAVHRTVVQKAAARVSKGLTPEQELRKDRPFPRSAEMFRIYLDNYDELEKVDAPMASVIRGEPSPTILALRSEYEHWGIPRHPKKGVQRQNVAEVQGAIVDGLRGFAIPKPEKMLKYAQLALLCLRQARCSQKQMQVIAGGLVYISIFRRAILGSLNHIWSFIERFNDYPPVIKLKIPALVKLEVARCIALMPLAKLNFRSCLESSVTASDASTTGGGLTVSTGLTALGQAAACCKVRGDIPESSSIVQVLTIGLFDGIGALRVAVDSLQVPSVGHVSVEKEPMASRVLESRFPGTLFVDDVAAVDAALVKDWACRYSQVGVIVIGAGPPCQGVSALNANRRGALKDSRSCLFTHVPRIRSLVQQAFPWAQVHLLAESVQSMDQSDRQVMTEAFETLPWAIDASGVSLAHRPRLYWISWELSPQLGVTLQAPLDESTASFGKVQLEATLKADEYLLSGWSMASPKLPTFTTARPRDTPGRRPAGLDRLTSDEAAQWRQDAFRYPPYQYQSCYQLHKNEAHRLPNPEEREVVMGFPKGYTQHCLVKSLQGSQQHSDARCTLIGNSWNVTVVAWLLSQLLAPLGLCKAHTPQDCVDLTAPGRSSTLACFLVRPPMNALRPSRKPGNEKTLVGSLLNQVSIKGEDVLLSAATEDTLKFHRLRASIPANLWRWRTVCGWQWRGLKDHINVLELRAVLCGIRWRIAKQGLRNAKFVHLVDSLVCLHSLARGRTSSRKMRRTLCKINSLLLASRSHGVWTYVHTSSNPADRPSRRGVRRKWARK
eukprot:Skav230795  [mRNA]  locus=scaffold312:115550:119568:+ [translate_table: standard]